MSARAAAIPNCIIKVTGKLHKTLPRSIGKKKKVKHLQKKKKPLTAQTSAHDASLLLCVSVTYGAPSHCPVSIDKKVILSTLRQLQIFPGSHMKSSLWFSLSFLQIQFQVDNNDVQMQEVIVSCFVLLDAVLRILRLRVVSMVSHALRSYQVFPRLDRENSQLENL